VTGGVTAAGLPPTHAPMVRASFGLGRLLLAAFLLARVVPAVFAPELPLALRIAAAALAVGSAWRPAQGLVAVAALAPAGLLWAAVPAHASELLAWAFLAGWLGGVWRPLAAGPLPRVITTAAGVYAACLVVSWAGQALSEAQGVSATELPGYLLRMLPADHVIFSSPEPETWSVLHAVTGLALLMAALALSRGERRLALWLTAALVMSMAGLGLLTVVDVLRQWAAEGYGGWFLLRYLRGVRFSAHLPDLNAAGSQYVLAGLAAAALATAGRGRARWTTAMALMLPALWLCGSRSAAVGALAVGVAVLAVARRTGTARPARRLTPAIAAVLVVAIAAAIASASLNPDEQGSATHSLQLRTLFLQTSVGMIASAPLYGVGVGQYLPRSAEFMPPALHAVYPFENAHNFFAQQFAELGLLGGAAFMALVVAGLSAGWRSARAPGARPVVTGLFAATAGYLLTCLTGHPLLVPEAAFPFWVLFGVACADAPATGGLSPRLRLAAGAAGLLLLASLGLRAADYARLPRTPVERGFHDERTFRDGTKYRWSTRHAVTWVPPAVGFLSIPMRAPEFLHRQRPFVVQVEVDGRVIKQVTAVPNRWTTLGVSLREPGPRPWRRIDVRVNQVWTPRRDRGHETDDRPMGVMLGRPTLQVLTTTPPRLP